MSVLGLLWWSSLLLAAIALAWMVGLIAAKILRDARDDQRRADRQRLSAAYLAIMGGVADAATQLKPYQHRSRLLAETLLEVLGLIRGGERDRLISTLIEAGVDDRFRARLTRGSRTGRLVVVEALSAFPSKETRIALRSLYGTSRDAELRIATVRTLIAIGDPPRAQDLLEGLVGRAEEDSLLYTPVLRQLAIDAPDDALSAMAVPTLSVTARAVLLDALGACGDYRALPVLSSMAQAPETLLRAAAVRALGTMGHPTTTETIAAAFGDGAWDVRAEAAVAAGKIGGSELFPFLIAGLEDPVWWVRFRAADTLSRMGHGGLQALRLAANSPVEVARRSASLALAEKGLT
jgi:HEAT repeat protein